MKINAREVAAEALYTITEEESYNTVALRRLLRQNGAMPKKDKAFVTELVNGTLRNLYFLDDAINRFSKLKTKKMKPYILCVLRLSVYQLLCMDRVPEFALVHEAVELLKKRGLSELSGFVNGVLRTVIRERDSIRLEKEKMPLPNYLSIRYSHPLWLVKMWLSYYPEEFVEGMLAENNRQADVTVSVNNLKTDSKALSEALQGKGLSVKEGTYFADALHVGGLTDLGNFPEFEEGLFFIQDESSMLAVQALDPQPGERILDLCAAPGGKSMRAAVLMQGKGTVCARDLYEHKAVLMEETKARLGLSNIQIMVWDALKPRPEEAGTFDRVLADVPCSGLGLLQKKPDIRYKKTGEDLDTLVPVQREILERAAEYVKPGGVLVYSTCTISKKENERNVEWFLKTHDFVLSGLKPYLPEGGMVTLYPHIHHTDGFFIARMVRKE